MVMQEGSARPEGSCTRGISDLGLHWLHGQERAAWPHGSGIGAQTRCHLCAEIHRASQGLSGSENWEADLA